MRKTILVFCLLVSIKLTYAQNSQRLELYAAPGLFFEQLNSDSLVPPDRRNHSRLGDVVSYGLQYKIPFNNPRFSAKAGLGFSTGHFSLNKYSIDDLFIALFAFDSPPRKDTFAVSYVRLTNNYLQVPVSFAWSFSRKKSHNPVNASVGINIRSDFLLKSNAQVDVDSSFYRPTANSIEQLQQKYTSGATKYVLTIEPYLETSFNIYRGLGFYTQFRPISFYSMRLNKDYTSSTSELLGFTFGLYYNLNSW